MRLRLVTILGLAAVLTGVAGLQRVFIRERQDALAALSVQEAALGSYAVQDLAARCRASLDAQRGRIETALTDPLADGSGLLYADSNGQRLPRQFEFGGENATRAGRLHDQLVSGELPAASPDDGPWGDRLRYFDDVRVALEVNDRGGIEVGVRAILTHRSRFVIDSRNDLVYMVALLDLLDKSSQAAPVLMERLLRDGLTDSRGARMPGLQVQLLERREKFSREDFEFLAEQIARLSAGSGVRHDDFRARVGERSADTVELSAPTGPSILVDRSTWYIESPDGELVEGLSIDLDSLLARTRAEMLERGLLETDDELAAIEVSKRLVPFDALSIVVRSPRWEVARTAIERRFSIKTSLAVALMALMAGAAFLWLAWTRRERQLLALKSDFVATVSHELRTPLASMRLMAETLHRRLEGLESARDYPERLVREIDSLDFLVENILSFNRLEKGRWEPRVEDVRISDIVRALEAALPGTTRASVRVQLEAHDDIVFRADPDLVRLLFLNLQRLQIQRRRPGADSDRSRR